MVTGSALRSLLIDVQFEISRHSKHTYLYTNQKVGLSIPWFQKLWKQCRSLFSQGVVCEGLGAGFCLNTEVDPPLCSSHTCLHTVFTALQNSIWYCSSLTRVVSPYQHWCCHSLHVH